MEELYYVDRPSIPATSQVVIRLGAILEHAIYLDSSDISPEYCGNVVEVRDSHGEIDGTLVYFPGVTYEELTSPGMSGAEEDELPGPFVPYTTDDVAEDQGAEPMLDEEFREHAYAVDLCVQLAAARKRVRDLEQKIAYEEEMLG